MEDGVKKYLLLFILFFSVFYSNAFAQKDNNTQEIFVTGLSVPVSQSKAGIGITTITQ